MGLLKLVIFQVNCINSKLSFLIFFYSFWKVNENWLVEKNSAPCIQYIPYRPKAVRSILITDNLHSVTSAINSLHISDVPIINKAKFQTFVHRCEGKWVSQGTASFIINLCPRECWVVQFIHRQVYPRARIHGTNYREVGESRADLEMRQLIFFECNF